MIFTYKEYLATTLRANQYIQLGERVETIYSRLPEIDPLTQAEINEMYYKYWMIPYDNNELWFFTTFFLDHVFFVSFVAILINCFRAEEMIYNEWECDKIPEWLNIETDPYYYFI